VLPFSRRVAKAVPGLKADGQQGCYSADSWWLVLSGISPWCKHEPCSKGMTISKCVEFLYKPSSIDSFDLAVGDVAKMQAHVIKRDFIFSPRVGTICAL